MEKGIQEIKDAYRGMMDNSVTLWNARLDLLKGDTQALAQILAEAEFGGKGGGPPPPPPTTNNGCGSSNNIVGCGNVNDKCTVNSFAGCGTKAT